jgi:hypothetical protein
MNVGWLRLHGFQYVANFPRRKTGHVWKTPDSGCWGNAQETAY